MRKRRILLGLVAVLALMAAACSSSSDGGSSTDSTQVDTREAGMGGDATILGPEVRSLDPSLVINSTTQGASLINAIYDTLYTINTDTDSIEPRIATDFTSDDGITWTMTLRDDVMFSDGTPLNAEAVMMNWQRTIDNARASSNGQMFQVESLAAPNATTFVVTLNQVNWQYWRGVPINALTWIASPASIAAAGENFGNDANVVGAGPFKVTARTPGSETTLVRNDTYWQEGLPKLDSFTFRPVADQQQVADTVTTGGADASFWLAQDLTKTAVDQGMGSVSVDNLQGGTSLLFNQNKPPFDNVKAREAVTKALDIDQMLEQVFFNGNDPMNSMFREGSPFYNPDMTFAGYNSEEAQNLFDELATENGGPLVFDMAVSTNTQNNALMRQLQTQLAQYDNVEASVNTIDGANYGITLFSGDFNLALYAVASPDPEPQFVQFWDEYPIPISHLMSDKANQAIQDGRTATDEAGRKAAYDSLQEVLVNEYPQLWMYRNDQSAIYSPKTTGIWGYGQGSFMIDTFGFVDGA